MPVGSSNDCTPIEWQDYGICDVSTDFHLYVCHGDAADAPVGWDDCSLLEFDGFNSTVYCAREACTRYETFDSECGDPPKAWKCLGEPLALPSGCTGPTGTTWCCP